MSKSIIFYLLKKTLFLKSINNVLLLKIYTRIYLLYNIQIRIHIILDFGNVCIYIVNIWCIKSIWIFFINANTIIDYLKYLIIISSINLEYI